MISVVSRDVRFHRKSNSDNERESNFDRISPQMARMLFSLEYIASHRYGITLEMLEEAQLDRFGTCGRTARRDASTLVASGLVRRESSQGLVTYNLNRQMRFNSMMQGAN